MNHPVRVYTEKIVHNAGRVSVGGINDEYARIDRRLYQGGIRKCFGKYTNGTRSSGDPVIDLLTNLLEVKDDRTTFYHGTLLSFARKICRSGIVPSKQTDYFQYGDILNKIFLTTDWKTAEFYSRNKSNRRLAEAPAIIRLRVPDGVKIHPDPHPFDYYARDAEFYVDDRIPEDFIDKVFVDFVWVTPKPRPKLDWVEIPKDVVASGVSNQELKDRYERSA